MGGNRIIGAGEPCPLPSDPLLAEAAAIVRDNRDWGWVVDREWRLVYLTDEQRRSLALGGQMVPVAIGEPMFGPEMLRVGAEWWIGGTWEHYFEAWGGLLFADLPGGREELRNRVDESLRHLVDGLPAIDATVGLVQPGATGTGGEHIALIKAHRVRAENGELRGTVITFKPAAGMDVLGTMALERDLSYLDRMRAMSQVARRPSAILFADLERSTSLSRSLSTAAYFTLVRRLMRASDACVVSAGGLVGTHAGDGVVAFFPVELVGSVSAAARACVRAARSIREEMVGVAERSGLDPEELVMRFGLHWGSTIYVGNISTAARGEVTALGDEVNEAARIEACASGGRMLASKSLIERLTDEDALQLGLAHEDLVYVQLGELATATDKARRDAPAIAVCAI